MKDFNPYTRPLQGPLNYKKTISGEIK